MSSTTDWRRSYNPAHLLRSTPVHWARLAKSKRPRPPMHCSTCWPGVPAVSVHAASGFLGVPAAPGMWWLPRSTGKVCGNSPGSSLAVRGKSVLLLLSSEASPAPASAWPSSSGAFRRSAGRVVSVAASSMSALHSAASGSLATSVEVPSMLCIASFRASASRKAASSASNSVKILAATAPSAAAIAAAAAATRCSKGVGAPSVAAHPAGAQAPGTLTDLLLLEQAPISHTGDKGTRAGGAGGEVP
mmetsp:Transcript_11767/g.33891  ORF Transcript_11767/g.33891 Transcript_11767/m.33891 type:complete len:246 (+) Transcript_11767:65-802(+)